LVKQLITSPSIGRKGPGSSMSYVVGLPNNSYKPITNTVWVRARFVNYKKGALDLILITPLDTLKIEKSGKSTFSKQNKSSIWTSSKQTWYTDIKYTK
jgi:hypothetical protein